MIKLYPGLPAAGSDKSSNLPSSIASEEDQSDESVPEMFVESDDEGKLYPGLPVAGSAKSSNLPSPIASEDDQSDESVSEMLSKMLVDSDDESIQSSSIDSEYRRNCEYVDIDADIAKTHRQVYLRTPSSCFRSDGTNEELADERDFKNLFGGGLLPKPDLDVQLKLIGSLPSRMNGKAIPLFTDEATGTDYQLHVCFTHMKGLHAYSHSAKMPPENEEDILPHEYAHSLLHVYQSQINMVARPDIVVPVGKLFVNRFGQSDWTGYEVFVSQNMEIWIIYTVDENEYNEGYPLEYSLTNTHLKEPAQQTNKSPVIKIAMLSSSIDNLESLDFNQAQNSVAKFESGDRTGSYLLLEMTRNEVSRALSFSGERICRILETAKLRVDAYSIAGRELLCLANEHSKLTIVKLKYEEQPQSIMDGRSRLHTLASSYGDGRILHLIHKSKHFEEELQSARPLKIVSSSILQPKE